MNQYVSDLIDRLDRKQGQDGLQEEIDQLDSSFDDFQELNFELLSFLKKLEYALAIEGFPPASSGAHEEMREVSDKAKGWLSKSIKGKKPTSDEMLRLENDHRFSDRLGDDLVRILRILEEAWDNWKASEFGYLEDFRRAIQQDQKTKELQVAIQTLNILTRNLNVPENDEAKKDVDKALKQRKRIFELLKKSGLNEKIIAFINLAASNEGAPLDKYSDDMKEKLKNYNLLGKLRVQLMP